MFLGIGMVPDLALIQIFGLKVGTKFDHFVLPVLNSSNFLLNYMNLKYKAFTHCSFSRSSGLTGYEL